MSICQLDGDSLVHKLKYDILNGRYVHFYSIVMKMAYNGLIM